MRDSHWQGASLNKPWCLCQQTLMCFFCMAKASQMCWKFPCAKVAVLFEYIIIEYIKVTSMHVYRAYRYHKLAEAQVQSNPLDYWQQDRCKASTLMWISCTFQVQFQGFSFRLDRTEVWGKKLQRRHDANISGIISNTPNNISNRYSIQ